MGKSKEERIAQYSTFLDHYFMAYKDGQINILELKDLITREFTNFVRTTDDIIIFSDIVKDSFNKKLNPNPTRRYIDINDRI